MKSDHNALQKRLAALCASDKSPFPSVTGMQQIAQT
jgi:hypothetical protein